MGAIPHGDLGLISPGDDFSASVFSVSIALNAAPDNEGSLDYLIHDATLAYEQDGLFQELDPESWYHLGFNLNVEEDLQDTYLVCPHSPLLLIRSYQQSVNPNCNTHWS